MFDAEPRGQVITAPLNGHARELPSEWRDSGTPTRTAMNLEWAHALELSAAEWLVKGILPTVGLASMYGPSRSGKSFLALEWALRLANGEEVLSARSRRCGVAYVAPEAPTGVRKRIKAWLAANDLDGEHIPFALIGRPVDFSSIESDDVEDLIGLLQDAREEFDAEGARLGLIVVDTLAKSMPGRDENDGVDMGAAIAALERIGAALGVLILVIHHVGKEAGRGARGHSSFFAALDTAIELTFDEESGLRRLKVAKQKDDEDGRSWAFKLRSVDLGADADGDPITSCVVDYVDDDGAPRVKPPRLSPGAQIVLRAIVALISDGKGHRAPDRTGCPGDRYAVRADDAREMARGLGLSDASSKDVREATRKAFARGKEQLIAHKQIFERDGWLWLAK